MLNPTEVARHMQPSVAMLELLLPQDGIDAARRMKADLLDANGIEPVLTILCLPDGIRFDTEGPVVSWQDGAEFLDIFKPARLRVVGAGRDADPHQFVGRVAEQIRGILPEVEARDIRLAYENHGESSETVLGIVQQVDSAAFRILLDPGNAYMAGDVPERVLNALLPHTEYMHVKDVIVGPDCPPIPQKCCCVGDGVMEWPSMLKTVRVSGRDMLFAFELPGIQGDVLAGYRRSFDQFRTLALAAGFEE